MDETKLQQKLRDLEALIAGATTAGERAAADNARDRILARLAELSTQAPVEEFKLTVADMWSKKLLVALLRRYDLKPFRYRGQRYTTVMVRAPRLFIDETLWPQFQRASAVLREHLDEVASRVITAALDAKDEDLDERDAPQRALPFGEK